MAAFRSTSVGDETVEKSSRYHGYFPGSEKKNMTKEYGKRKKADRDMKGMEESKKM
jgi:hypothetical protein